jgi:hypothetical protein
MSMKKRRGWGLGAEKGLPAAGVFQHHLPFGGSRKPTHLERNSLFSERSGNVYENKGSAFHERERSGNLTENKGTCALKAGMSLKTNGLGWEVQESGVRSQKSE